MTTLGRLTLISAILVFGLTPAAIAADTGVQGEGNAYGAWTNKTAQPNLNQGRGEPASSATRPSTQSASTPTVRYAYRTACDSGAYSSQTGAAVCPTDPCPEGSTQYRQWEISASGERPLGFVCSGSGPPPPAEAAAAPPPQVTDAMVLAAFRRVPVPELRSVSQPADTTLVNFETIFYTEAEPLTETVTILGQRVRLEIAPSEFRWEHGDGTSATTSTAGAPYPRTDVVYRYTDAHRTVRHRVVVTWSAQWSLNGGPLRPVTGTVTTTGPTTALRVAEAVPALSGQR